MSIKEKVILVVDDDPVIVKSLTKIFEAQGVFVNSASSLSEAKKSLQQSIPHLVFLDVKLKNENGLDFLVLLNTLTFGNGLPVIVFSGTNDKKIEAEAMKKGAIDFVVKPIVASLLIQKVRKYLFNNKEKINLFVFENYMEAVQPFCIKGEINQINHIYLELETNVKIASSTFVTMHGDLCKKIDFNEASFNSGDEVKNLERRLYLNKLYFIGASENVTLNIKNLQRG